ncbi:hypothetical protein CI109_105777 [Kwoniella shandongensis]|uniref:Uncharacterized protein n=1 Tax=Kwoniella shandongensis TaxID=1734106 RepID=A0A5M6C0T3_9TREE|nr:uncharacterized protein CI109_003116 [Kwoniella shandongensis]KAA5528584.1 hypothetical protein CI109_003116 [Kwoniella shandongensis]
MRSNFLKLVRSIPTSTWKQRSHPAFNSYILLVRHTLALIVLIVLADISLLLALGVKLVSELDSWNLACWTGEWFWGYMQRHWERRLNALDAIQVTGDEIPQDESALVICNHIGYSDYYLVQHLASRAKMLGKSRYFVKKEIVRIPLFGWAFWAMGMILVSRDWTSDERLIEKAFAQVKENKHDCWIVLYPEGTRRTPNKILRSKAYAKANGKQELDHVLFPRTKGFVRTVRALRDSHIRYLYDLTFLYTSPNPDPYQVPSLAEQLSCEELARAGYKFRIHVRRIPLADLPEGKEELQHWCEQAWAEKDKVLSSMMDERGRLKN